MHASVGDEIVVETRRVGARPRRGRVEQILGSSGHERYVVKWDDGRESVFSPGSDARLLETGTEVRPPSAASSLDRSVRAIMSSPAEWIDVQASLRTAAERMSASDMGALVVRTQAGQTSVVSERDIVRTLASGGDPDDVWAGDVASVDTVCAVLTDSIADVGGLMRQTGVRHIPIRDGGDVVGMVSMRDVLDVALEARQ